MGGSIILLLFNSWEETIPPEPDCIGTYPCVINDVKTCVHQRQSGTAYIPAITVCFLIDNQRLANTDPEN